MHLANSGRVIVQLSNVVPEGQILCDSKGDKVGKVMELIGPVAKPFASAAPLTNNIHRYSGKSVYALEVSPAKKQKFRRKRK